MSNFQSYRRRRLPRFTLEHDQRGQAIVLIALMIVLMLGMAALAIDGGGLFFLKRDAQNAADAAALIASRELCVNPDNPDWPEEGRKAATENGFTQGVDTPRFNNVYVTVAHPGTLPAGAPVGASPNEYAWVEITATKPSYFSQFVYQGTLDVRVEAVSRCVAPTPPGNVPGIVGLRECGVCPGSANNTVEFTGAQATITGGVHSNCNCKIGSNASEGNNSTVGEPATCVGDMIAEKADFPGDYSDSDHGTAPEIMTDPLASAYKKEYFAPGGHYAEAAGDDTCDNDEDGPGGSCYHSLTASQAAGMDQYEGLYYITGNMTGSDQLDVQGVGPKGVTFVLADGVVKFKNTGDVFMKPYVRADRLLIVSYKVDVCTVVIDGPANKPKFAGIVYAPDGECSWSVADLDVTWGAFICQKANISGSNFTLFFDPTMLPPGPGEIAPSQ
jgi:hypothetical protein